MTSPIQWTKPWTKPRVSKCLLTGMWVMSISGQGHDQGHDQGHGCRNCRKDRSDEHYFYTWDDALEEALKENSIRVTN